jgi:hypothetical protein
MDVINTALHVVIITACMFVEPPLPDTAFPFSMAAASDDSLRARSFTPKTSEP